MHFQPYSARCFGYRNGRTKSNEDRILIDAAEKSGAKVVVYGPQSSETVDLLANIFTNINRPGRKSARAHKGSAQSRPRFGPNEVGERQQGQETESRQRKKEMPENCL